MWFKKKNTDENATNTILETQEEAKEETVAPVEEWIWVDGYKGTDEWMRCRDYQYELHKTYDISDDREVEECAHGFHLCKSLDDVFRFYPFAANNRFFRVKALVRKTDDERYYMYKNSDGMWLAGSRKLAAKSIIFTEEIGLEELCREIGISDWSDEHKELAHSIGVKQAQYCIDKERLIELGYSDAFANVIIYSDKYDIAYAVGTQENLSMDMKAWIIFNGNHNQTIRVKKR